ncbi:hypothetical protein PUN28_009435 [Cardiocondyla obscurior]|uniref:Uncharacterized protein n=1 Tax=Cardiocondyla obscurior TaxID=286306 RepID=A0AAW2FS14_9HYME
MFRVLSIIFSYSGAVFLRKPELQNHVCATTRVFVLLAVKRGRARKRARAVTAFDR